MARKKTNPDEKRKTWISTPVPNMVRHTPSGTYYLRARVGGAQPIRRSLDTTDFRVAKNRIGSKLDQLRAAAGLSALSREVPQTLDEALSLVEADIKANPASKTHTLESYERHVKSLRAHGNAVLPGGPIRAISAEMLRDWWKRVAGHYEPQGANHRLMLLKRALRKARETGAIFHDVGAALKRMRIPRRQHQLLTGEQFRQLIESIRAQLGRGGRARANEAADWIEFMTFSGPRPEELRHIQCEDIDARPGFLRITGGPEGTKNHEVRWVPISPPLQNLLKRIKARRSEAGQPWSGPIFSIKKPHEALKAACKRLGFPHQRIYDLRHTFATMCAKSGVDVPTFAKWLGHKDGGALAMRVYVHPDEEHSLEAVKKLKF